MNTKIPAAFLNAQTNNYATFADFDAVFQVITDYATYDNAASAHEFVLHQERQGVITQEEGDALLDVIQELE